MGLEEPFREITSILHRIQFDARFNQILSMASIYAQLLTLRKMLGDTIDEKDIEALRRITEWLRKHLEVILGGEERDTPS